MNEDHESPRGRRSLAGRAFERGMAAERRAAGALGLPDLGTILTALLDSPELQASLAEALRSDGARQVVAEFFDGPLFDQVVDELLASRALGRLVDEIAGSPAVTAAITQQGFGFADQVGQEVRARSRRADAWTERVALRLRLLKRRAERRSKESAGSSDEAPQTATRPEP